MSLLFVILFSLTGEMFSTCARSLAAMSRDLAHVLNIESPVNRLESISVQV